MIKITRRTFLTYGVFNLLALIKTQANILHNSIPIILNLESLRQIKKFEKLIYVQGYKNIDDGGEGFFRLDLQDTISLDNDGTIIVSSNKRYKRIYHGAINVQWFGAKGDGMVNDLLSFQNAFSLGEDIYIPKTKKYYKIIVSRIKINEGLINLNSNQTINSNFATLVVYGDNNISHSSLFKIKDKKNILIRKIILKNITNFDKRKKYSNLGIDHFICIESTKDNFSKNIIIENCEFYSSTLSSIHTLRAKIQKNTKISTNITINNCKFFNIGTHCVGFNYVTFSNIINCYAYDIGHVLFKGATKTKKVPGMFVDLSGGCKYCKIDNNIIENCRAGIKTQHTSFDTGIPTHCIISNNIIKGIKNVGNGYAIQIIGDFHTVIGNTIDTGASKITAIGIILQGTSKNCTINSNTVECFSGVGIEIKGNNKTDIMKNHSIIGNIITSKKNTIFINKYANHILINGNTLISNNNTIQIKSNQITISNNLITSINKSCLKFSGEIENILISNNQFFHFNNSLIIIDSFSNLSNSTLSNNILDEEEKNIKLPKTNILINNVTRKI